ncbi:nuclear control of ATP synthase 2 [Coniophora puteana RWD-64-598 SS2]|uniref:Nuclear control of ATP synthase 2 n=1 Tax=Coniophora puteana (strain RWD-64-598) TaxID=741705 RepID=A0A5M3MPN0_CONPW|nr:nuclear control of ATP synthase 2 [Coniophora puteana RWD-64-598 SS2]EIW81016.1 nuclear control of ATP synthase 2 [Coniophora puteana RWD-64-598 SS2]
MREETTGDALSALIALRSRVFDRRGGQDGMTLYENRPSRLTLLWPRLVLVPPLALMAARYAWASRGSLREFAGDAAETAGNFYRDWLVEPVRGVLHTIRAGSEGGIIVTKEAVDADLASLERMSLSLAQEKLKYTSEQLDELSRQIRTGDLTTVLRLYEEDIKTPLRSAVGGSLIRSVLVQVQKAKVDIDQALKGIDKLLKSQELTFAFVGVAPAFAIVYVTGGFLTNFFLSPGKRAVGGKRRRMGVWLAMRRVERLLIVSPRSLPTDVAPSLSPSPSPAAATTTGSTQQQHLQDGGDAIPPLTAGLLLLSVTHLRQFAERSLPGRSALREGFLEDVRDLEDPGLGRAEKLRVVDRMWKSWGETLGWTRQARV